MFYDKIKDQKPENRELWYWDIIDGKPLCQWYHDAENTINILSILEERAEFEIDVSKFSYYFRSYEWVHKNDPDALKYILSKLHEPVSEIVKENVILLLNHYELYTITELVNKFLRVKKNKKLRLFIRQLHLKRKTLTRFINNINSKQCLLEHVKSNSEKFSESHSFRDILLMINFCDTRKNTKDFKEYIQTLIWFLNHSPNDLDKGLPKLLHEELLDQIVNYCVQHDYFELLMYLKTHIKPSKCKSLLTLIRS